jgi:membrane associated rhomboid family serine protease
VDVTLLLVALHGGAAVTCALLTAFGAGAFLVPLVLDPSLVRHGAVWQLVTYPWVHPPGSLLWLALELYFFFRFGREVERFVGRKMFALLYAGLALIPALMLVGASWWLPSVFRTSEAGSGGLHFSMFLAFAILYPGVESFFRITMQTLCFILLGIYSLMLLAGHDWGQLLLLWSGAVTAYGLMRWIGVGARFGFVEAWFEERRMEKLQRERKFKVVKQQEVEQSLDSLLDKISRSGMNSLTKAERAALEKARAELLKKEKAR